LNNIVTLKIWVRGQGHWK